MSDSVSVARPDEVDERFVTPRKDGIDLHDGRQADGMPLALSVCPNRLSHQTPTSTFHLLMRCFASRLILANNFCVDRSCSKEHSLCLGVFRFQRHE